MEDETLLERITCNPNVMAGKPVIRGTRLTVEYILNLRAHGASEEEIVTEYTGLTLEDIQACYLVAGRSPVLTRRHLFTTSSLLSGAALMGLPLSVEAEDHQQQTSARKLRVVVVGGHPDDPESGCGGTIARYSDLGHEV